MKRFFVIIITFLLLCADARAQGGELLFWGIPFGSSKADLITAIKACSPDAIVVDERLGGNTLIWRAKGFPDEHLHFEGFEVYSAAAEFAPDDKLTGAYVGLIPESGKKVFELYFSVKSYLTARYGKPESDYAFFKSPYHQGGGQNNVWAVIEGKCVFTAFWTVYHHEKPITISIDITSDQQVELSFVNEQARTETPVLQKEE